MEIQVEIRKLHPLIQKLLFKEIALLILTNQYKALFVILINQNKVLCIKAKPRSENSRESVFLGTTVRLTIFSNIQLIKKMAAILMDI